MTHDNNANIDHLFAYTGRMLDMATGLQNNLNRWYDANIGRWVSEDPIGFAARDGNRIRVVGNAIVAWRDPSGLGKLFGQNWVWPWDDRASWDPIGNAKQYGRAALQATCGGLGGASIGAAGAITLVTPAAPFTGPGFPAVAGVAGVGGAVSGLVGGLYHAAVSDDIESTMELAVEDGFLGAVSGAVTPVLPLPRTPAPVPRR